MKENSLYYRWAEGTTSPIGSKCIQVDLMQLVMLIRKAKAALLRRAAARTEEELEHKLSSTEMNIKHDKENPYLFIFSVPTNWHLRVGWLWQIKNIYSRIINQKNDPINSKTLLTPHPHQNCRKRKGGKKHHKGYGVSLWMVIDKMDSHLVSINKKEIYIFSSLIKVIPVYVW